MTVVDRLRRAEALEQALDELVSLLQADELDIDDLDQAVRHADTVLIGSAKRETRNAELVAAPDSEKARANMPNNIRTAPTFAAEAPAKTTASPQKVCEVDGCERKHVARGYCGAHYDRVKRHGDPRADVPIGQPPGTIAQHADERAGRTSTNLPTNGSDPAGTTEHHEQAHVDNMIGAVSGPHRAFTLVDRRGKDVAVEAHPDPDDPAVWAAMLGRVHAAIHDEPVVVTHQPAAASNGQAPVQRHQAGIG